MAKKSARKPNAAFMKPVTPDSALSAVVGSKPLPRTELTKKLWDYIKKNGLQDKKDRKTINADAALKVVFGGKSKVSMFEMTKLVSGHVSYLPGYIRYLYICRRGFISAAVLFFGGRLGPLARAPSRSGGTRS